VRRLVLKISMSVDGFVGAVGGDVDWIFPSLSEDATQWMLDTLWQADTHVMGRVTYQGMAAHWPTSTEVFAAPMNEIPKVVFSRTLSQADWGDTRVAGGDLAEEIGRLKQQSGKDIVAHGGAGFVQALSSLGLIDEYRLLVHPVALGRGLPLFADSIDLEHCETTVFSGGSMAQVYRPA
jgi:dihydrofolate reductase